MPRVNLTDRFITTRKPAPQGKRADYADSVVPGLALRVTDRGHKSFVLVARYPTNPTNPTRRALGDYGKITLVRARETAREWLELIGMGKDPKIQKARERATALRQLENSFAKVAAEFLVRHGSTLRKCAEATRIIETEFVERWGPRPITDILPEEVAVAIRAIVNRGAPYQAHNALGYIRRLFTWAIGTHEFGIGASPVAQLRPRDLIGARDARERVLDDDELCEVWSAAGELGYPYGPLFRLLVLTGQRAREIADIRRPEISAARRLLTIAANRMKGGRAHEVPLGPEAFQVIESLPLFNEGEFVFTTTNGTKPVNGFSKAKVRLNKLIEADRIKRGVQDEKGVGAMPPWVIHDIRRTVRTHLSALPVEDAVRELVIAHAKRGLHKIYDQHAYQEEKRLCLMLWERRLLAILSESARAIGHAAAPSGQQLLPAA